MAYRILFIDEEKDAIDAFKDYIDDYKNDIDIEVKDFYPKGNLDEMIDILIKENPDAIVTDYNLNEKKTEIKHNVSYDGVELAEAFMKIRSGFPVFITTSYDDTAIKESEDVNIVYVKPSSEEDNASRAKFIDRVIQQILHYRSRITEAEEKLKQLIEKSSTVELDEQEERELIKLDRFLEGAIDKQFAMPDELKTMSNSRRLISLIEKVDNLLGKFEK